MKKQMVRTLLRLGFLAVIGAAGVGSAHGQSLSNPVRANIPFDFTVADKKFSAGDYYISRVRTNSGDLVLRVSSVTGHRSAFQLTSAIVTSAPKESNTLIFHQYGDQYFLFEVWPAGANTGRIFLESRAERDARASIATNKVATQVRTVSVTGGPQ
jgi:hypothetical protein